MKHITESVWLDQPKDVVFDFLANVENLPLWATEYCSGVRQENGRHIVETSFGPMLTRHDADRRTGVIDMCSGLDESDMALFPVRVIAMPNGRTLVSFTFFQPPDLPDDIFARQHESLKKELAELESVIVGHAPRRSSACVERSERCDSPPKARGSASP